MGRTLDLDWRADAGVCVRTPLLPLTTLLDWAAAEDPRRFLDEVLRLPEVDEALFVASPSLHGSIASWRAQPASSARLETALVKYVARASGRATPFGLFSGISTGTLGAMTSIELAPRSDYRRRTRLDNDYLFVPTRQGVVPSHSQVLGRVRQRRVRQRRVRRRRVRQPQVLRRQVLRRQVLRRQVQGRRVMQRSRTPRATRRKTPPTSSSCRHPVSSECSRRR